jgi:hypothetical protein
MADLIRFTGNIARIEFDKERKLKPKHRYIRAAVQNASRDAGQTKSVADLTLDPFSGHPYLIQALLAPNWTDKEALTLDQASDLIDDYYEKGGKPIDLQNGLVTLLADYLHIEVTKHEDEGDDVPNADTPAPPGRTTV